MGEFDVEGWQHSSTFNIHAYHCITVHFQSSHELCWALAEEEEGSGSAETQEKESCQQRAMELDRDEGMEELAFVPSAVSDTAG